MYTIITDQQITRNRKVHLVFDGDDACVFSSPLLKDCIEWLKENAGFTFMLDFGDYRTLLRIPSEPHDGQDGITGWLHKPKKGEPEEGADPQTASQLKTS